MFREVGIVGVASWVDGKRVGGCMSKGSITW